MALCRYRDVVQDTAGNAISGASVAVVETGTTTPATLYSDLAGNSEIEGGTVLTDSGGLFGFYTLPGIYDLTMTKSGYPTQTDVGVAVIGATSVIDALRLMQSDRVYPTWGGVSQCAVQFRGATDTSGSLGTLGLIINGTDAEAATGLETSTVSESSLISGSSPSGDWFMHHSSAVVTKAWIGQKGMTAPLQAVSSGTVDAASAEFTGFDFASEYNVRYVVVLEGPPTNYAGTPGAAVSGSARMVTVYGIPGDTA